MWLWCWSAAALHFVSRPSEEARDIRALVQVELSAVGELELLLERHRRIVESAPVKLDRKRIASLILRARDVIEGMKTNAPMGGTPKADPILQVIPALASQGERALDLAMEFAQGEAIDQVAIYAATARALQACILDYKVDQLARIDRDVGRLIASGTVLTWWVAVGSLIALVLIGPVSFIVTRQIVKRLGRIVISVRALALNDTTVHVSGTRPISRSTAPKLKGGGRHIAFDPIFVEEIKKRRILEQDVLAALRQGDFTLHYQPVIDVAGERVRVCEALMRWSHPAFGPVSPAVFIPIAEAMGIMGKLGAFAVAQACRDALAWPSHIKVAVNVSAVQLAQSDFYDVVVKVLEDLSFPPERLELEITETVLMGDDGVTMETLTALRGLGITFALDDARSCRASPSGRLRWTAGLSHRSTGIPRAAPRRTGPRRLPCSR